MLGDYRLGAVIKRSTSGTVYETEVRGDDGVTRPAAIKVRELDAEAATILVNRYRNAMPLEHPNLLRLYAAGTVATDGLMTVWVVMERADESLAGVLSERALSEDETGEMLEPALAALAYLHKNGYAHGALKPSNVFAVGDQIKLSCDNAVPVPDGGTPADDIGALAALIMESLTERGPRGVIRHSAGRFAAILRHCSEDPPKRWTAEQIAAHLTHPAAELPQATASPAPATERSPASPESRKPPLWIFAALAAVVLTVLLTAVLRRHNDTAPAPSATAPPAAPSRTAAQPAIAPAPSAVQPDKEKPFAEPAVSTGRKADGWFVIVAAYGSRDAAEKRVRRLGKRFPAFHPTLSEHNSERAPWLVTLGGNLSEAEAEELRARAIRAGLPRDAYIKRIK